MSKSPHRVLHGLPLSQGIGYGNIHIHDIRRVPVKRRPIPEDKVAEEVKRFEEAVKRTREQLKKIRQMVSARLDRTHAAIFEAQEMLLDDPLLIDTCKREIRVQKLNAEFILEQIVHNMRRLFEQIEAPHISPQNLDVLDVAARLRENLMPESKLRLERPAKNTVIVAHALHPSDTAHLSGRDVLGIITETGGRTSHFAILAKALSIPTVVVEGILDKVREGDAIIVDGYAGKVTLEPSRQDMERLRQVRVQLKEEKESLHKLRDLPSETVDGYGLRLMANIEFPSEIEAVKEAGAQGIGLFRTEFFYIDRGGVPSEEEQFQVYKEVVEQMAPLPVTFRTLDLGGDKLIADVTSSGDKNPFLGMRSIRLCLANPEIFMVQLRALLRASAYGRARIMFPLVTDVAEIRQAKQILDQVRWELRKSGTPFDDKIQIGSMIETPAAALTTEQLAQEVDFFSIGTNDLIQYTLAVDRATESVSALYNPLHPSVIHLIRRTIDSAHQAGITVAVCGEVAADPGLAVLLMGLGIDELSMGAAAIPEVKRMIRSLSLDDIRQLRMDILSQLNSGRAKSILELFLRRHGAKKSRRLA